jgi:hypothetical protein
MKRLLILLLVVAFFGPVALAASRSWKSSGGHFRTEAELVGFKDGKVELKKTDGKVIEVPLDRLSDVDQQYVKEHYPEAAAGAKSDSEEEIESADKAAAGKAVGDDAVQDVAMKLLPLDPPKRKSRTKSAALADYVLRLIQPQQFVQVGKGDANDAFHRVVKKEPKYVAPIPFRGVVTLGGRQFGFALDAVAPKASGYDKLYFDANGNGDLTDDQPVSATEADPPGGNMPQSKFPRVNVTLDVGGERVEYAFLLSVTGRPSGDNAFAIVSLHAAVAREGYVTLGAKRTKVVLVDRNSNGRFDDMVSVLPGGNVVEGDLLLIDPNPKKGLPADGMATDRNPVGKVLFFGKRFYRLAVTPSGSKLQLTPVQLSLGSVAGSGSAFRAVLTNDEYGVVTITGKKDEKVALAAGTWKLINYTLDATRGNGGRTAVEAAYANAPPSVVVKKGETAKLPFGSAFHPVVTATRMDKAKVYLGLEIVGSGGERCRGIFVNGSRPPKPHFTIKDKDGKIVQEGDFEYG